MSGPPPTDEGWYVLHEIREIDWERWRDAPAREQDQALEEGQEYLESALGVEDAEEGISTMCSYLGEEGDLMMIHFRSTIEELDALRRQFEHTEFARFTERTENYLSVTEASGYTGFEDYFDPEAEAEPRTRGYIESRLYPDLPDKPYVSFYPMDKRRSPPEYNWYDTDYEERAEHMEAHGAIGRQYAGKIKQMVTGSIGMDDWEWGVTLFAESLIDVKDLLYEMRFDPSSSRYAEFGPFYVGRRFPPADLPEFMAGEAVPTNEESTVEVNDALLSALDRIDADHPSGHGVLVTTDRSVDDLSADIDGMRSNFEHYDSHVQTTVHADEGGSAVLSLWETADAADTASGFLTELEGEERTLVGPVGDIADAGNDDDDSGGHPHGEGGHPHGEDDDSGSHPHGEGGHPHGESEGGNPHSEGGHPHSDDDESGHPHGEGGHPPGESGSHHSEGGDHGGGSMVGTGSGESIRDELADRGIYAGTPHGEDIYAMVVYSEASPEELAGAVGSLEQEFHADDEHVSTNIYDAPEGEPAVVSLWESESAATTAASALEDLPGVIGKAGEGTGFTTMGMFYTVEEGHREDFVSTFEDVGEVVADMEGHEETVLYTNEANANDMFIASHWASKADAMELFTSDVFGDTVEYGREILAERPRHVFLA